VKKGGGKNQEEGEKARSHQKKKEGGKKESAAEIAYITLKKKIKTRTLYLLPEGREGGGGGKEHPTCALSKSGKRKKGKSVAGATIGG